MITIVINSITESEQDPELRAVKATMFSGSDIDFKASNQADVIFDPVDALDAALLHEGTTYKLEEIQ